MSLKGKKNKIFNKSWVVEEFEIPTADATNEGIYQYLGDIASTCSGVELTRKRAIKRGKACATEAANNTPSKVYEYLPFRYEGLAYYNLRDAQKKYLKEENDFFEFYRKQKKDGVFDDFHVFGCRVPQFVWSHIATHRSLSPLKRSVRMGKEEKFEFWLPDYEKYVSIPVKRYLQNSLEGISKREFQELAIDRYNRKEIYNRWPSEFRLVDFTICGFENEFENFFAERAEGTGTQKETREFAEALKEMI